MRELRQAYWGGIRGDNDTFGGVGFVVENAALKLGKVAGEPTAGWIIFTGAQPLIDGSAVRGFRTFAVKELLAAQ
jgi:hypothetical protein